MRRRAPFAALTAYWLLAAAISFRRRAADARHDQSLRRRDGSRVPPREPPRRSAGGDRVGRRSRRCGDHRLQIPGHSPAELVFIPLEFGISWLVGYAVRERAEQAEAAEVRATEAERERGPATRTAVAEERARIARELHDVLAYAVSVMVLQVGAVRDKLPEALEEDRSAPSEASSRLAALRSPRCGIASGPCAATARSRNRGLPGFGFVGVRERVKIYGGEMSAGPATGRGFILSPRLPLDRDQR
jgi:signal transduction histidine kinase